MSQLNRLILGVLECAPSEPAIEFEHRWWTWSHLSALINAVDVILRQSGFGPHTRVGAVLANRPEIAALLLGLISNEQCVVTLNPSLPDDRLAQDILTLKTPVVIALAEDWGRAPVRAAVQKLGALGIELTGNAANPARVVLKAAGSDFNARADGICIEMLSSGTTGTPKRIPLKTRNFEKMIMDTAVYESRDANAAPQLRGGVQIVNSPFSHISGIVSLLICVTAGRKACLLDRFAVDTFMDAIRRHRPKAVAATPPALRMLLDAKVPTADFASLKVFRTGTAPLDPDLADAFFDRYGVPVLQNYGATEFAGGVAGWTIADFKKYHLAKRGSVGRMNPGVEARVVDADSGQPLPFGADGLLELRGKHLGDGQSWMRTTDLSRLDSDGFLWILGRHDNAIIRGGFKINPDDVVRAIESHPAVREASVVALPDSRLGQVPAAAYILKSGEQLEADALRVYLRDKLLAYQIPVQLMAVADLPRTPSLKVSQPDLKKLFAPAMANK